MTSDTTLLLAAIEDNIGWCSAICASHHSAERNVESAWVNLAPSPPFYPNIITRRPQAQADVVRLVEDVRQQGVTGAWGIKDSFHDLDLSGLGFEAVIEGQWFGREHTSQQERAGHDWETVRNIEELSLWEKACGEDAHRRIFKDALLNDARIQFWMLRHQGEIIAGCISFSSETVTGLSNWFAAGAESVFDLGLVQSITEALPGKSIVFWASESAAAFRDSGFRPLGKIRVWMTGH